GVHDLDEPRGVELEVPQQSGSGVDEDWQQMPALDLRVDQRRELGQRALDGVAEDVRVPYAEAFRDRLHLDEIGHAHSHRDSRLPIRHRSPPASVDRVTPSAGTLVRVYGIRV